MLTVGFCRVDGLVLESISRLSTRRESQLIPGSLVKWWLEVRTSCGLLEQSKDTELAFHNGMFRTGDIGYQDSDSYCYILNPLKDMIVTSGENVYSGEVEAVISKHPAVQEGAVFGIPAPQWSS
jgi:long-chain acyl-CoA synthetase